MPILKFGIGVLCYLFSVILISWTDLKDDMGSRIASLVIGVSSMSTVFMTVAAIAIKKCKAKRTIFQMAVANDNPETATAS